MSDQGDQCPHCAARDADLVAAYMQRDEMVGILQRVLDLLGGPKSKLRGHDAIIDAYAAVAKYRGSAARPPAAELDTGR